MSHCCPTSISPSTSPTGIAFADHRTHAGDDLAFARPLPFGCAPGPSSVSSGKGGRPRTYSEESLLLIGLLRTLWRLSYADMRDWLKSWPALALACGLPLDQEGKLCIPSPSQQCRRRHQAGAPVHESLFSTGCSAGSQTTAYRSPGSYH
ncbi:MAG TPA: hypothetical protein VGL94_16510 [Ktedonobacteraceae bacterium]